MLDKIAVILPIRYAGEERKIRLGNAIDSWEKQSEGLSDLHVIIDDDNVEVFEYLNSDSRITSITVQSAENTLMQKINTIALDIASKYAYMAFSADDIVFETPWESKFIDYLKSVPHGVVYGNDTVHGERLPTHPCVSSNLVTTLGFFGCPGVAHNFFDNYWHSVGLNTKNMKYFDDVIMRHMHPISGRAVNDELNVKVLGLLESDGEKFRKYMDENFAREMGLIEKIGSTPTKTLDLGCGTDPKNPFNADEIYGVDIVDLGNSNIRVADLAIDPIPYEDNSFDYVTGYDFLEHIPRVIYLGRERKQPFIDIMSEVWRVLKPGGIAYFATPAFPTAETFQDPQHVNFISERTILYFCEPSEKTNWDQSMQLCHQYGFTGRFEAVSQYWREDVPYHLVWELRAVK